MEELKKFVQEQLSESKKMKDLSVVPKWIDYGAGKVDAYARILLWMKEHETKEEENG